MEAEGATRLGAGARGWRAASATVPDDLVVRANAAVIHYQPEHGSCATIDPAKASACDTDGTTDVTRTVRNRPTTSAGVHARRGARRPRARRLPAGRRG